VAAIEMAEDWIAGDEVTHCLVIAAEEHDWLSANGAQHDHRDSIAGEGAAAILFGKQGSGPRPAEPVSNPRPITRSSSGRNRWRSVWPEADG